MPKALILYADGKQEVKVLRDYQEYQKIVGGNVETLPLVRGYVNPDKKNATKRSRLLCYVNDEGMVKHLPLNPYAGLLSILGVRLSVGLYVFGNVIVFADSDDGDDKPVDPYIVKLFADYKACDDEFEEEFYLELEALNKPVKKVAIVAKKAEQEVLQPSTKRKNEEKPDACISTKQAKLTADPEMKNRLAALLK